MSAENRTALGAAPMHRLQVLIVGLCIVLNALDGFDVLAISFAAPGIAKEWGIDRAVLGIVLSMELFGMAAGSVLIGNIADRVGRRPTIIGCLVIMAAGMFAAAFAQDVTSLSITRLLTGLGIGGLLSATSAMVAEFSSDKRRSLNVSLNIAGYSTGSILGGLVAAHLLADGGDWRSVFWFGGILSAVALPLAWFILPESIDSLIARRPAGALEKVNGTLARLGHAPLTALPEVGPVEKPSFGALFSAGYARSTILLTIAYFAQIMFFYYLVKWVPKIIVDLGFDAAQGSQVSVFTNIGNLTGAIVIGLAAQRFNLKPLVVGAMLIGFVAIGAFGVIGANNPTLVSLAVASMIAAFFINAGVVGLYPLLASTYPARLRASGTGFVIGMGRGGSAVGPVIAGALFAGGFSLLSVSLAMGIGALIAATAVFLVPRGSGSAS